MKVSTLLLLSFAFMTASCIKETADINSGSSTSSTGGSSSGATGGSSGGTSSSEDPLAAEAWHLKNTGQNSYSENPGTSGEDIDLSEAVALGYTGSGVRVAVSDSGTEVSHEDLSGNQLTGEHRNYGLSNASLWRGSLPYVVKNDNHGTGVAGLIAAVGWNGLGSRGVAPDAKFSGFRFVGVSSSSTESSVAKEIDQMDGDFDIFNFSYGDAYTCQFNEVNGTVLDALDTGATELRSTKGAIYVQSAGNSFTVSRQICSDDALDSSTAYSNSNFSDALTTPLKIIVGAINANGLKSSYSTPGSGLWISAPGGEFGTDDPAMITTDITGCSHGYSRKDYTLTSFNKGGHVDNKKCNYTSTMNGTSSAAPVTSGVIALMLQANPALSIRDVKYILALTADKVDYSLTEVLLHPGGLDLSGHDYDYKWIENNAGLSYSNWYGFGRINALQAVLLANTYTFPLGTYENTSAPNTDEWYYDSGTIAVAIPDEDATGATSELEVSHNFLVESVQVEVTSDHTNPADLGVILISPNGTESRLLLINSNVYATTLDEKLLMTNAFFGESSLGTWTLKLVDGAANDTGNLTNWKILIHGHRISLSGTTPDPVSALVLPTPYSSLNVSPNFSFDPSPSLDVVRYEVSIGTSSGETDVADWTSVGLETSALQLTHLTLTNNTSYFLNIRAISNKEKASSIVTESWDVDL
jgi:subtilisin-like proprotein convertase family protein